MNRYLEIREIAGDLGTKKLWVIAAQNSAPDDWIGNKDIEKDIEEWSDEFEGKDYHKTRHILHKYSNIFGKEGNKHLVLMTLGPLTKLLKVFH